MSIASAITAAQGKVADCYTAISNKGGTLPATQNLSNMPTAINSIPSGSSAIIDSLTITPTTSQQTITASGGVDGYSPITVNAVTSSIDNNITAGNIKSGVSILGVSGSLTELKGETRSVSLTNKNGQTFTPSSGKNGITSITVTPNNQAKTITPTTSQQTISVPSGYSGFGTLTVNAVTSSIDANITAGNIKKDVQILGVTGTYEGGGGGGYSELPSYQVSSGVASRRSGALTGTEFSNITSVGEDGLYNAFYNCTGLTGSIDLSALTSIDKSGMYNTFRGCTGLTGSIDLSALTSVGQSGMNTTFYNCTGLTGSIDLSALTSIGINGMYNAFYGCTGLTSVDLSALTTISGQSSMYGPFYGCTGLTSVDLSALTTISGQSGMNYAFRGCTGLTRVDLSALTTISGQSGMSGAFYGCTGLTDIYFNSLKTTSFGSYKNQFTTMLSSTGTTKTHTLHFPSNLSSTISGLTGYPTFGGTSGYVTLSFDLPATS